MKEISFFEKCSFEEIKNLELEPLEYLFENLEYLYIQYEKDIEKINLIKKAYIFGKTLHQNQKRETGVPYFTHPLIVSLLMMPYKPSHELIIATLLHDAIEDFDDESIPILIKKKFGKVILNIIDGVSKVSKKKLDKNTLNILTLHKLFSFGSEDSRVLIIKIFDRLHNIITINGKKSIKKRLKKVEETMNIYIPAIEKLGLWEIKVLLENACMKALYNHKYKEYINLLTHSKSIQSNIIKSIKSIIQIPFNLYAKSYSSSYFLYKRSNINYLPEKIFFIEILASSKKKCYEFLLLIRKMFPHEEGSLKDYILYPKENGYKALHITSIIDSTYKVRIHILTKDMSEYNNYGIFCELKNNNYKLPFLSESSCNVLEKSSHKFISYLKGDVFIEKISVHNKKKGSILISKESTLLDLAALLYPNNFQYISKSYINNKEKQLYEKLKDNDIVDFIIGEKNNLDIKWIYYIKTPFAKDKLIELLSLQKENKKIHIGYSILQKVFDDSKWGFVDNEINKYDELLLCFNLDTINDLYIHLAEGRILEHDIYIQILNIKQRNFSYIETFIFDLFSSLKSKRIYLLFESVSNDFSKVDNLLKKYCKKYNIDIVNSSYKLDSEKIIAKVKIETFLEEDKNNFLYSLKYDPRIEQVKILPSVYTFLIFFIFFILPVLFSLFILKILRNEEIASNILLYSSILSVSLLNSIWYFYLTKYFNKTRYNSKLLLSFVIINLLISAYYIYNFLLNKYDIYTFYLILLAIVFSIILPVFFSKDENIIKENEKKYSLAEYKEKQKQKIIGYLLRFGAVIIWGIEPILFKYSAMSKTTIENKVFLYSLGVMISSIILIFIYKLIEKLFKKKYSPKTLNIPFDKHLFFIIFSSFLVTYFMSLSLNITTSTNYLILNNFAPIFALIIAFIFWRLEIPYLKNKTTALSIFLVFFIGIMGVTSVLYDDLFNKNLSILGGVYALMAMITEVLLVISQIRYSKKISTYNGIFLTGGIFFFITICLLPIVFYNNFNISLNIMIWGILTGFLSGLAFSANYEIFKRIDGFLAYLMLNLSIFISFFIEYLIFNEVKLTYYLILGFLLTIGASIVAEFINIKSEKKNINC
jgi:guanosine-3',5'-bis(diphosphate) 3'-pyrophosphohydrolase